MAELMEGATAPIRGPEGASEGRASAGLVAAMFLVTLVTLALQICLSRALSVTVSYHFAFLIVALAMLGMASSAITVFVQQKSGLARPLSPAAAAQVAAGLIATSAMSFAFVTISDQYLIVLQFTLFALMITFAFYYCGYVVAFVLSRYSKDVVRLYLFDLVGAAIGCLFSVLILDRTSALNAMLACAWVSAGASILLAHTVGSGRDRRVGIGMLAALTVLLGAALEFPAITRLRFAKQHDQSDVIWEKWNSLARVTVSTRNPKLGGGEKTRPLFEAGWGMSDNFDGFVPETLWIELDSDAGTQIIHEGGIATAARTEFLKWDVTASPYWLKPGKLGSVFIIGGGGGRDVLTAARFGAEHIDVVEINPAVAEVGRDAFSSYNGHVYALPPVRLIVGNARSELASLNGRYDIIQMSMIDTWAASMAGQLVLTENTLYTQEAYSLFLSHLKDDGILSISRWYDRSNYGEVARVLALMGDALQRSGVAHPAAQIAVLYTRGYLSQAVATCLMKRSPFLPEEVSALVSLSNRMGFKVLWPVVSGITQREQIDVEDAIQHVPGATRNGSFDLSPPSDERPFFFNTRTPLGSWVEAAKRGDASLGSNSSALLLLTLIISIGVGFRVLIRPLRKYDGFGFRQLVLSTYRGPTAYFVGIGFGFMLIELSLIQRYIVFLGHPTYALSVVLFSLLLFTGLGSFASGQLKGPLARQVRSPIAAVIVCVLLSAFLVPSLLQRAESWAQSGRMALAVVCIAPLATCMGMLFPTGVRLLAANRLEELVPWMWGVNGFAAVVASVVGMLVATSFGYTTVLVLGALSYGLTMAATYAFVPASPDPA